MKIRMNGKLFDWSGDKWPSVQGLMIQAKPGDLVRVLCNDGFLEAEKLEDGTFEMKRWAHDAPGIQ